MDLYTVLFAFGLTVFAGLSTGIGSLLAFFANQTSTKFLSFSLGFSAGVMIYVSFVEIFFQAKTELTHELGLKNGYWITIAAFFGGILLIAIIDKLVPSEGNPHEIRKVERMKEDVSKKKKKLMRMGLFTALAIGIHNFPEGIATFIASLSDPKLGVAIAVAVAIHNIPEGIAVSVPIYYATGSKKKAFWYSFASGLAEPVGAFLGYLVLMPFLSPVIFGVLFAGVAGIMVFISIDELLPTAIEFGEYHLSVYGFILGMLIMALSLIMFV